MNVADTDGEPAARRTAPVAFVLATVLIAMLGVGLVWPILPKLINELAPGDISEAAYYYGIIATVYALAQFVASPLLGSLSDAYGRKPILIISQAGLVLDYLLLALAPNLWWLAFARLISGVFGATITTANAYMADITSPEDRSRNFGLIGATFGVGFIIGPLMGGILGEIDLRLPFYVAAGLALANVVFGLLVVPESLPPEKRRTFSAADTNPVRIIRRVAQFPALAPLLFALFITNIAQRGLEAIWVLYTEFRFGWGVFEAGFSLAFVGVMFIIVQGGLVGPVVKQFGEWKTVTGGFFLSSIAMAFYSIVDKAWMVFPLIAVHILGNALAGPALSAIASKSVADNEQGMLQGTLSSINSLAIIIGPFAASMVLATVTRPDPVMNLPGAWFILASVTFALASALVLRRMLSPGHETGS